MNQSSHQLQMVKVNKVVDNKVVFLFERKTAFTVVDNKRGSFVIADTFFRHDVHMRITNMLLGSKHPGSATTKLFVCGNVITELVCRGPKVLPDKFHCSNTDNLTVTC